MKIGFIELIISIFLVLQFSLTAHAGVADEAFAESGMSMQMRLDIKELGTDAVYSLPIPILENVQLTDLVNTWDDARSEGRTHEGIDIFSERGTQVISPTNAVVGSIGYGAIGGNFVFTINPGGERYYFAHLDGVKSSLKRGDVLSAGDVIGYVGNTGNADHAKPHLHFGIYAPHAINPFSRIDYIFSYDNSPEVENMSENNFVTDIIHNNIPTIDLEIGDDNESVRLLQIFLINQSHGVARDRMARAGSTGYFGSITKNALIEYQQYTHITPSSGYYGPITRAYMKKSIPVTAEESTQVKKQYFSRDLELGEKGDDVKVLQQFLNSEGYIISQSGAGSAGNETKFFGRATQKALISFQADNGIYPSYGYFGYITRTFIETM